MQITVTNWSLIVEFDNRKEVAMSVRTRNSVRAAIGGALATAAMVGGGVGIAAASNPSDLPTMSPVQPDGCFVVQDRDGVMICQQTLLGTTVIGDYPRNNPRGY